MRTSARNAGKVSDSKPLTEVFPATRGTPALTERKRAANSKLADAMPAPEPAPASKRAHKAQRKRAKKAKSSEKHLRQFLSSVTVDGDTFSVGDDAYLRMTDDFDEDEFTEVELCQMCGYTEPQEVPMIECDRCLLGYHITCLRPPLTNVPKGDWLCPSCVSGKPRRGRKAGAGTAREHLLAGGKKLALVHIQALWQEPDGSKCFAGRWYEVPENTHTGRQKHHAAREVFLTRLVDNNGVESLWRLAQVCLPDAFAQATGDDAFICEYEYDAVWQRFRRRTSDVNEDDSDWAASDGEAASDEEADGTFKPQYAFWAEKGAKGPTKGKGTAVTPALNRHKAPQQGGSEWIEAQRDSLSGLGAAEIPASSRQGEGASPLARAQAVLALTANPRTMPCRDSERAAITSFVEESLTAGSSSGRCLYVSGVPGTGKTATVLETMRSLRRKAEAGHLPAFQFVEINSLRLPSPQHAYTHLYEALTGNHVGPTTAAASLEEMFSSGGRGGTSKRVTVLLVDEMDLLVTKKQTVLYNLFEWPVRKGSRLAVIGVANTMDLPERLLPRIASRLGSRRVVFQPYTRQQLETIAKTRLEGLDVFESRAIEYAARKVAAVSGDVRRCLELLRRAAEITEAKTKQAAASMVKMSHVDDAINEMFQATHMQMMRNCCRLEKMLLAAVLMESRARGHTDVMMENVHVRLEGLCQGHSEPNVAVGAAVAAATRLGSKRLILADPGAKRLYMRMSLNVPVDDLSHILKHEDTIEWLKDLSF
ncbi:MAG: origin recognition complex subunit 1-like [Trebouxia sp. A1-2]|nr:MAG: origin recognition complex subunit 1-like [Trebouxia sp. A1-2]